MKPIGVIGDIHGIPDEFEELLEWFNAQGIPDRDIWLLGDLVDRGPDSGKVVRIARRRGINSVLGNHESSILTRASVDPTKRRYSADKDNTLSQLTPDDLIWLSNLPKLQVFDDLKLVLVHGGIWPNLPFHKQPHNVIRAQMIRPFVPVAGESKWWGPASKPSEEYWAAQGFKRWYEVYDGEYAVAFGHSVFYEPLVHTNYNAAGIPSGTCYGLDQGGVFGGWLTGMIYNGPGEAVIHKVPAKRVYVPDMLGQFTNAHKK